MMLSAILVSRRKRIAAFVLLIFLFASGLFDHSLWSSNDAREGAMIQEMFRTSRWVTPIFNGKAYLEKPPLLHWAGLVLCNLFGTVNEGLVRLPAALFGFGAVFIAYLFGRAMGREAGGIAAAFMCATSVQYFEYSKVVLTDTALTFMIMLSLYLFWKAYCATKHSWQLYALFTVVSAFSFYAKGLLGPGIIWISVCAFLLYEHKWKLLFTLSLIFLPVFLIILAPWMFALWKHGGINFIVTALWANQFGRFFSFHDPNLPLDPYFVHKEPITYYLVNLPMRLMPWVLLVPPALVQWFRKGTPIRDKLALFLRIAFISIILILHLSSAKATSYALPLFPILFLMIGTWLQDAMITWTKIDRRLIGITATVLSICLLVTPLFYIVAYLLHLDIIWAPGAFTATACLVLALLISAIGLYSEFRLWQQYRQGLRAQIALPAIMLFVSLFILNFSLIVPIYDYQRTYKPFAELVRGEIEKGRHIALASDEERECGQFMFYLNRRLDIATVTNNLVSFLTISDVPVGAIVPTKHLTNALQRLSDSSVGPFENQFRIIKNIPHTGYKCKKFVLILNDFPHPRHSEAARPAGFVQ